MGDPHQHEAQTDQVAWAAEWDPKIDHGYWTNPQVTNGTDGSGAGTGGSGRRSQNFCGSFCR